MSEVKCYSVDVPMDVLWNGLSMMPNEEKITLPTKCKGFIGVNPDYRYDVCHFLYDTPKHRNKAYERIRKKDGCFSEFAYGLCGRKIFAGKVMTWI